MREEGGGVVRKDIQHKMVDAFEFGVGILGSMGFGDGDRGRRSQSLNEAPMYRYEYAGVGVAHF